MKIHRFMNTEFITWTWCRKNNQIITMICAVAMYRILFIALISGSIHILFSWRFAAVFAWSLQWRNLNQNETHYGSKMLSCMHSFLQYIYTRGPWPETLLRTSAIASINLFLHFCKETAAYLSVNSAEPWVCHALNLENEFVEYINECGNLCSCDVVDSFSNPVLASLSQSQTMQRWPSVICSTNNWNLLWWLQMIK